MVDVFVFLISVAGSVLALGIIGGACLGAYARWKTSGGPRGYAWRVCRDWSELSSRERFEATAKVCDAVRAAPDNTSKTRRDEFRGAVVVTAYELQMDVEQLDRVLSEMPMVQALLAPGPRFEVVGSTMQRGQPLRGF